MAQFFQETVDSHRKTFDPSNLRDIVDTYILEIQESTAQGRQMFGGRDPDRQIQQVRLLLLRTCDKDNCYFCAPVISGISYSSKN
jgi:hypothetical protein